MNQVLLNKAIKLDIERKRRQWWHRIVQTMVAIVVFCTTYALILPAITMEREAVCGMESHEHGADCYVLQDQPLPVCTFTAPEGAVLLHTHDAGCSTEDCELWCTLPERSAHIHGDGCYGEAPLICTEEEREGHSHSEACTTETVQICQDESHEHEESCYEIVQVECAIAETDAHIHQTECYGERPFLCEVEETVLHRHEESCYDADGLLICTMQEILEHIHTPDCNHREEPVSQLICILQEHIHQDICYVEDPAENPSEFLCGFGEHIHNELCSADSECSIPEHTHDASCILPDLDLEADLETQGDWEQMFSDLELTGKWPANLVAVASTQTDYRESTKNVILQGEILTGYSRYGAKFDDPYGNWSGNFVRFCMEYAEIEDYPQDQDPAIWLDQLKEEGYFRELTEYIPNSGDLVFMRTSETYDTVTMAIVTRYAEETEETPAMIQVIQGDHKDQVAVLTYELTDDRILGYGEMLPGYATEKVFMGEDFAVTVILTKEAKIPEHAEITVREILPDTEEYNTYYQQAVESLLAQSALEAEEELTVSFARFFDIGFMLDGEKIEPTAPVKVQIQYAEPIPMEEVLVGQVVHFADEGIELLDTTLSGTATLAEDETQNQQVDTFSFTQESFSVSGTMLSNARAANVTVWLDGTCGGLMAYTGSPNSRVTLQNGILPTTWTSPSRYRYKLNGWYDIDHGKLYAPGAEVDSNVDANTVFYADWIAEDYNLSGANDAQVVQSIDTSSFITTYVFDYNALFNVQSSNVSVDSGNGSHTDTWTLVEAGFNPDGTPIDTLDFTFRDMDSTGKITRPNIPDGSSQRNEPSTFNSITKDIYTANLTNLLFNPDLPVVGKYYVGQGNYLYQYISEGSREGYYYYDSAKNAASYNQRDQRFYIHNYTEYTYDTFANELNGTNADFLPFNYRSSNAIYQNEVAYASKSDQNTPQVMANFFYGIRSDIHFYLPNDAGATDNNGNYLNKSTTGSNMVFEFSGDDDVWVLVDGDLLLDIGGIHMARGGKIDFSEGKVYTTINDSEEYDNGVTFQTILGNNKNVYEGPHTLTIYYLERGSSMSNCAIYFNLAPRYGLDLTKKDYVTGNTLSDVEFQVFTDETCTMPARLWNSHSDGDSPDSENKITNIFKTNSEGIAHMWGWVAGKTYYIKETKVPPGYECSDDLIRITLNNHGTDISELTVIRKSEDSSGFEVISHLMNKENHHITITLTNKKLEDQLMDIRVEKKWADGTVSLVPVTFTLKANGEAKENVTLSVDNSWGHTWKNLPIADLKGNAITYSVEEQHLPGYRLDSVEKDTAKNDIVSWVKVGALEDSAIFMLALDNNTYLTTNGNKFATTTLDNATASTQWTARAHQDGFQLHNGSYYLSFDNGTKTFKPEAEAGTGNQTFYYDGTNLFVMSNNIHYYVGSVQNDMLSAAQTSNSIGIYKKVITKQGTLLYRFTNSQIKAEDMSKLRVEKSWAGDYKTLPEKIQIHVKLEGQTVTTMELTAANGWSAEVEGLDKQFLTDGKYFLEEVVPTGFTPEYGEIQNISIDQWNNTNKKADLVTGKVYAFVANGNALADDNGTVRATTFQSTPALNQQWQVVECVTSNGTIQVLRNKATNRYLREHEQNFFVVDNADGNCSMRLYNSRLQFYFTVGNGNGWSLTFNGNNVTAKDNWGSDRGTPLTVYEQEQSVSYKIGVTNTYYNYILPETGGPGTIPYYALGGLLMFMAVVTYLYLAVRGRQKGGR